MTSLPVCTGVRVPDVTLAVFMLDTFTSDYSMGTPGMSWGSLHTLKGNQECPCFEKLSSYLCLLNVVFLGLRVSVPKTYLNPEPLVAFARWVVATMSNRTNTLQGRVAIGHTNLMHRHL